MRAAKLIRRTPLVATPGLGAQVWLKLENQQRTGSFKLRGAVRKIASLDPSAAAAGVITASAGNHGAGLAAAAGAAGIGVRVVVPGLCPANKRARIAALGAEVVVHGAVYDEAELYARAEAKRTGAQFVSAYDDEDIIEGNGGDLARELLEQAGSLFTVVCPVGGGGLIGGLARVLSPRGVRVIGVQPEANCAMRDSLVAGRAMTVYTGADTCAEGCEGAVAERTFELTRDHAEGVVTVSEDAIRAAVAWAYHVAGQVVECSAAVAIAGLREGHVQPRGTTVVVVSGGNIEPRLLDELIRATPRP